MSRSNSKTFKRTLFLPLLLLILSLFAPKVYAYRNGYYINNYDVDITVNEDNTFDIVEKLTVHYDDDAFKHGIVRAIPLRNDVKREDGSTHQNRVHISNVYVNAEYETYSEDGEYCIQIGSADTYVKGDVDYVISYTYDMGRDPLLTKDEFYFNIIGTGWDTSIMSVDFAVHFPKEFTYTDQSLGFSHGSYGNPSYENVYYKVENDTVYGYYHEELEAYEGLTMRLELPEGYFVRGKSIWDYLVYAAFGLPVIGFALSLFLYLKYGRNDVIVEPVEFYPPDGRTPTEIGYYYDDHLNTKDITSLLVHLANKGCLTIEEDGDDTWIHLKKFPEKASQEEKMFYNGLAKYTDETDSVRIKDLENKFYRTINSIENNFNGLHKKKDIIVPTGGYSFLAALSGALTIFISVYALTYLATYDYVTALGAAGALTFISVFFIPFFKVIFSMQRVFIKILFAGILIVFFLFPAAAVFGGLIIGDGLKFTLPVVIALIGLILGLGSIVLSMRFDKRTPFGNEIKGRVRGFRNFLEKAEKNQLEMLVEEDPSYFYDILPYAYVLGVSSKWIKKFDGIAMEPPTWYYGYNDMDHLHEHLNDSMSSMNSSMTSSPEVRSSSGSSGGGWSSSGSSGGGFSGGGSGGGGGHSW